jgi:membrane-bound metal-dependent hydrolase YbcI (DUF457 family)
MFPIEHALVAFLPVSAYVLLTDRRLPSVRLAAVVFLGSQFPDLVDKPLAYQFGLIPSGRVFMHSLPVALPFLAGVAIYGRQTERPRLTVGFAFAYASHLVADNYGPLFGPRPRVRPDLLWPFADPVARPDVPSWAGVGGIHTTLWTGVSVLVLCATGAIVLVDLWRRLRGDSHVPETGE